jgi:putative pyruvate formate lyase activating enzyme
VSTEQFAEICLALQARGAENINIVTGSHAVPAIAHGLEAAKKAGLRVPALWNSSAYESPHTLDLLEDHIDIYLPDLKTLDTGIAGKFFNAPDYPQVAASAILKMIEMSARRPGLLPPAGNAFVAEKVIIRHLILPGLIESTRDVLKWFAKNAKGRAMLSLMTQYTPISRAEARCAKARCAEARCVKAWREKAGHAEDIPAAGKIAYETPRRYLNKNEYNTVISWLEEFGIDDGFCQELVTGNAWLPDFGRTNPFSSKLSEPVF